MQYRARLTRPPRAVRDTVRYHRHTRTQGTGMDPTDPPPANGPTDRLPRHTTPTWEVELLISGVAVFAMLQLTGWLNQRLLFLLPRFDEDVRAALTLVFSYTAAAAVILAATFALHLMLRAYWIALVGMHSVYPGGIRWERLRMGPIEREVMQQRDGDFPTMIERADNRASIVFAAGVALATLLLGLSVLAMGLFAAGAVIAALLPQRVSPLDVLVYGAIVIVPPTLVVVVLDRSFGKRMRAGGRLRRTIAATFNLYASLGFASNGGVLGLLASHHGRRKVQAITAIAMMLCIFGVMTGMLAMRAPERLGNYAWFPHFDQPSANAVDAIHYDDQRDPLRDPAEPFVQSAIIAGEYVRLVVPYQPDRDIATIRRMCPDAPAMADADARAAALLDCLASAHAITLDGKALPDTHFAAGSDPRTDRPALVAMIDVRDLARGRHVLAIARPAAGSGMEGKKSDAKWVIPFWR